MKRETAASPFSAQNYKEQQNQWLQWRSEMLQYQAGSPTRENAKAEILPPVHIPEPVRFPEQMISAASFSHTQLDSLNARHKAAEKNALNWQTANITT